MCPPKKKSSEVGHRPLRAELHKTEVCCCCGSGRVTLGASLCGRCVVAFGAPDAWRVTSSCASRVASLFTSKDVASLFCLTQDASCVAWQRSHHGFSRVTFCPGCVTRRVPVLGVNRHCVHADWAARVISGDSKAMSESRDTSLRTSTAMFCSSRPYWTNRIDVDTARIP